MNLTSIAEVESCFLFTGRCWVGVFVKRRQETSRGGGNAFGLASSTSAALEQPPRHEKAVWWVVS